MNKLLLILCILLVHTKSYNFNVHIFGDSHAFFCFNNTLSGITADEKSTFFYEKNYVSLAVPFNIYWLGSRTMFRVGRDGMAGLAIKKYGVKAGDVAVFFFGEIDVRCHIGKQRDEQHRNLNVIIEELVRKYIQTLVANRQECLNIKVVVVSVAPPSQHQSNPQYPWHGSLEDRVAITKLLNRTLELYALQNNLLFLDIYSQFSMEDGSLNMALSDGIVHIHPRHNAIIKEKLIELIQLTNQPIGLY